MNTQMIICMVIFAATLVSYMLNKIPMWLTAMISLAALYFTGCIDASGALAGFSNVNTLLMATMNKPKLLLLDEHTAALDPKTALKVLTLSARIVEENHLTTMMITHNMKDAIKYGNRLIMMHEGHIIYDVAGEEKQKLHVSDLLAKFQIASGGEFANDRMILSN